MPNKIDTTSLPECPGVYFFLGPEREILYIGKATSLRSRVRSYFNDDILAVRGPKIEMMLAQAVSVECTPTDSVLEALILEAKLIKTHHPVYNSREKDDKSFNYVAITKEDFPRVLVYRGRNLLKAPPKEPIAELYGPFPSGGSLRLAMKVVRKLFPFRDKCEPGSGKPCFNRQLGLCPGVCTAEISKIDYRKQIRHLKLFFEGKKSALLDHLQKEMTKAAADLEFERAAEIKKTIFSLTHIQDVALIKGENQIPLNPPLLKGEEVNPPLWQRGARGDFDSAAARVATPFRIEAYDVAHISGHYMVGVMVVVENGEVNKSEYRKFKIKTIAGADDTASLSEVLRRRLSHPEWRSPHLIAVDGGTAQKNAAMRVLRELNLDIPVVGVVKDERHRPKEITGPKLFRDTYEKEILVANAEAHRFAIAYHRQMRDKIR